MRQQIQRHYQRERAQHPPAQVAHFFPQQRSHARSLALTTSTNVSSRLRPDASLRSSTVPDFTSRPSSMMMTWSATRSTSCSKCEENSRSEEHTSELQSLTNLVCRL